MLVHIVADHPNKISDLRPLFGSRHVITSALLYGMGRLPRDCDAIIAAADLRNAENIEALKTVSTAFKAHRERFSSSIRRRGWMPRRHMHWARRMYCSIP